MTNRNRRTFLKDIAACGAFASLARAASVDWKKQIGLEVYTVRDLFAKDPEGTLAKVAEIGYKEIEPTSYANLDPKQFRAVLDRYGLSAPSTHAGATDGPDLEKQLEGFQVMGIRYTEIRGGGGGRAPAAAAARAGGGRSPETEESVKRSAQQINQHGRIAKKFGMKMLIHNHTQEFEWLEGGKLRPYDVLLAETDPALVAMQLDIGWASVAGQNILQMFQKNPGRYELWHVKDATGIKSADPKLTPNQRREGSKLVPVGQGEVDYKAIFAKADVAGLKHFCIEQDNAAEGGDAMAAAKASYQGLWKQLG
ncbi:Xylose isomerase domain-containing protein TIM barrel [Candidatus Sulfopaludibacter sp. SbA6]|nr:Xylose isomerase domain-containing protein TIM barrel [Candidatus Sulfopaludibacter sp. SbA6]